MAGDIGGTKSWLGLFSVNQNKDDSDVSHDLVLHEKIYTSAEFENGHALIKKFIDDCRFTLHLKQLPIASSCLALPGIVKGKEARLTNLDWVLHADDIKTFFSIPHVSFINDFQAAAEGVASLRAEDYKVINTGLREVEGTRVITGAGTGLGLAWMQKINGHYRAFSTEGGHVDFAPANHRQAVLFEFLEQHFKHVSWERLLSGSGICLLYRFCWWEKHRRLLEEEAQISAAEINQLANEGDEVAEQAMQLFVHIYAAWIGNVALLYKPSGGLYIAGGVSAHIASRLLAEDFKQHCFNKGRMSGLVKSTPIYLITNTRLGLEGAALVAKRSLSAKDNNRGQKNEYGFAEAS